MITLALFVAACLLFRASFKWVPDPAVPLMVGILTLVAGIVVGGMFMIRVLVIHGEAIGRALKFVVMP